MRTIRNSFLACLIVALAATTISAQGGANKNDPRREWVAPNWEAAPTVENDFYVLSKIAFLWVLNPGTVPLQVTVTFRKQAMVDGVEAVYEEVPCTKTVPAGVSVAFWAPLYCDTGTAGNGSLSITANGPVLPSGYLSYGITYKTSGQVDVLHSQTQQTMMQFYTR